MNDGTRLIRVSIDLLETFGSRAEDGRALSFEWNAPTEFVNGIEPVYIPTVTMTDDGFHICREVDCPGDVL